MRRKSKYSDNSLSEVQTASKEVSKAFYAYCTTFLCPNNRTTGRHRRFEIPLPSVALHDSLASLRASFSPRGVSDRALTYPALSTCTLRASLSPCCQKLMKEEGKWEKRGETGGRAGSVARVDGGVLSSLTR